MSRTSAIIAATLRALMEFYGVMIPKVAQPSLVLSVDLIGQGVSVEVDAADVKSY